MQGINSRNATWKEHHMTGKMGLFEFEEIEVTNAWGTLPEGLRNFVWIKERVGGKYEGWNFNSGNYLFTTVTK